MSQGNLFAYLIILIWPLFSIWLYRHKSIQVATLITIVGGFMVLPVKTEVDLPMIPAMGKHSIPALSALLGVWWIKKQPISYVKQLGKMKYLVILLLCGPFITAHLNSDMIIVGGRFIKGLSYYDGLSAMINQFLLVTPFFIGRQVFKTHEQQLLMFKFLVAAGLVYSLPILFEVRMSPQLHTWIYGYFPHDFGQQKRYGGFRPVVFMGHGLLVAFFIVVALTSVAALSVNRIKIRQFSPTTVTYYFLFLLILCKSIASLCFGLFSFVLIKFAKIKVQHHMAMVLVCLAMLYPTLSIMKLFPHQGLVDIAESVDKNRAQSLQFRFDNEERLLARGQERLFFGWGGWGRGRVYDEHTGKDISVTDGRWIQVFGSSGFMGFIAGFGLLAFTVLRSYTASKVLKVKSERVMLAAHAVLVGIIMVNQIPNSSLGPWLWLLAGILLGRSDSIIQSKKNIKV